MVLMGQDKIEALLHAATDAYHHAYAPYSQFAVGAAVLDEHGEIHSGCNIENAAYPSGSCAEEQAIGSMVAHGGRQIRAIAIIGYSDQLIAPCGACRQRIREFADIQTKIHICHIEKGHQKTFTIEMLLPDSFGPENLSKKPEPKPKKEKQ